MKIAVIGSGFSSLSAACYLAQKGHDVDVFEKNDQIGGRARVLEKDGFTFDMGPSWYWMPDVFERFFADFGKKPSDYYTLERLSPSYRVFFNDDTYLEIPDNLPDLFKLFEAEEPGSSKNLKLFLAKAEFNYKVAIENLVYRPGVSPLELVTADAVKNLGQFFSSTSSLIRKLFISQKLIKILEFPVLFLGAKPNNTPAFYSFMNYADLVLGTWYPQGGMSKIAEGMQSLAEELGVKIYVNSPVSEIKVVAGKATSLVINKKELAFDKILSGADYHHTETLLPKEYRAYSESYWDKKVFAPSSLLFFVGFDKRLTNIQHHNLFFDEDFEQHAVEIYDTKQWPEKPLFYACFTSVSDKSVAPENNECGFFLMPIAPGIKDSEEMREKYFDIMLHRLEKHTGQSVRENINFKQAYCVNDFVEDYNSYKGNAYGMANTLAQTAFLRPKLQSKKVQNLFFAGQLTVPGPGVPPALISGKLSSQLLVDSAL